MSASRMLSSALSKRVTLVVSFAVFDEQHRLLLVAALFHFLQRLIQRVVQRGRLFVNGENLTSVRQTRMGSVGSPYARR
jgi:hypothetical protein